MIANSLKKWIFFLLTVDFFLSLQKTIAENYAAIQLYPEGFGDYLLSQVGFSTCEELVTAHHSAKGFRRPIHIYTKPQSHPATPSIHDSNVEAT